MSGREWSELFRKARARRELPDETTAFRLFNGEADGMGGLLVDWFDGVAVVGSYQERSEQEERAIADGLVAGAGAASVYLKRRPKEARQSGTVVGQLAPTEPLRGESVAEKVVREAGLGFLIRPPNGLSVGLYLDARDARRWVRESAKGRTVLNTFAYTCGFGVAALAGRAAGVLNVDASQRVLDWGRENHRLNGQDGPEADFLAGDVLDWLPRFAKKGRTFDLVVLDPPSFATTRGSRFSIESDYGRLVELAVRVVSAEGLLLACCNFVPWSAQELEAVASRAAHRAGLRPRVDARLEAPDVDFPGGSSFKAVALRLAR